MTPDAHAQFTQALEARLAATPDVVGLVLLGSSSGIPPLPDAFSDHDFFVVTQPGMQERFRADLAWLPDAGEVVLAFRETAHGLKALYRSGHLVEFAVFDADELALAKVNRYRVAFDRADVTARMERVRAASAGDAAPGRPIDERWHAGQLLTLLVVGAGRWRRGERLSAHQLVRVAALGHLVALLRARAGAAAAAALDDLDPFRRLERALPAPAAALDAALRGDVPATARAFLDLAVRELGDLVPEPARAAVAAVLGRA